MADGTQTRLAGDAQMPRPGTIVGDRYEIRDVLGEGGFAVVYRALDVRTKAEVAVKVLDPLMSRRNEFASRFMREVETVSRLRHHNTISVYDAGETDQGCLYLVMELLEGKPLDEILDQAGRLPAPRVKRIGIQILKSLQEAHAKGIIHRDLKPANVFVADVAGESDYVKVLDFGIAKTLDEGQDASLTATGQVMCSPHYVAPERIKEHLTLPASDLYSLGVMLIELLEGAPPYTGDTPMMLAVKHLQPEPVPLGEHARRAPFAHVLERAVAKSVDERYTNALEMLDALTSTTAPLDAPAPTVALSDSAPLDAPPARRRRVAPLLAVLALAALGVAAGLLLQRGGSDEQASAPAGDSAVEAEPPTAARAEANAPGSEAEAVEATPPNTSVEVVAAVGAARAHRQTALAAANAAGEAHALANAAATDVATTVATPSAAEPAPANRARRADRRRSDTPSTARAEEAAPAAAPESAPARPEQPAAAPPAEVAEPSAPSNSGYLPPNAGEPRSRPVRRDFTTR